MTAYSNDDGIAELKPLQPGTYTLHFKKAGYVESDETYTFQGLVDETFSPTLHSSGGGGSGGGAKRYRVTFETDGGTTIASKSVTAGSTLPLTGNPIKEMYTFVGWGISPGGAVVYSPGSSIVVTANITLYAVYEADY
nr:MAG TPA: hypothetical protein [Herelleviridae sp.]